MWAKKGRANPFESFQGKVKVLTEDSGETILDAGLFNIQATNTRPKSSSSWALVFLAPQLVVRIVVFGLDHRVPPTVQVVCVSESAVVPTAAVF